jgi:peptidyl-prolyl cis-trans isomerase C
MSKLRGKIFTIIIVLIVSPVEYSQEAEKVIAKVGSYEITEDIFLERYELTPQMHASVPGITPSLKKEVLFSLIAEKLWALEAEQMGLSNSELIQSTYKAIEKMYVRDALYRKGILSKVELTEEYLTEAFRRNSKILKLNYLFSSSENEINQLYSQLIEKASFDSLLNLRLESRLQSEYYQVTYGQMDKEVEDSLYKLKVGQFTAPVKAPNGWYIFKLISTEDKIIENAEQAEAEEKNVLKIARATLTDSVYRKYYAEVFSDMEAKTNGELFTELSDLIIRIFDEKKINPSETDEQNFYLSSDDLYTIEAELGEQKLSSEFVELNGQSLTLDDFIQELAFEKFSVDTIYNELILGKLNRYVKNFIEHEVFTKEGYKQGLQNLPEVQRYLNMWKTYLLSDALRSKLSEDIQVNESEIKEYANENLSDVTQVKIIELLTEDLDIIRDVFERLDDGEDFRMLAVKYTIRQEAKNNSGELGYFPVSEFGEIGRAAASMEIGEMYGPVNVPEGYSVFQLVDKREEQIISTGKSDKSRDKIELELKYKKFSDEIINKTVELADKYGVSIDEEVLNTTQVLNTTTVVYRYFGFGGRLLAVPMTIPNFLWVKPWEEKKELNP